MTDLVKKTILNGTPPAKPLVIREGEKNARRRLRKDNCRRKNYGKEESNRRRKRERDVDTEVTFDRRKDDKPPPGTCQDQPQIHST